MTDRFPGFAGGAGCVARVEIADDGTKSGRRCLSVPNPCHGSFRLASRPGTVCTVNAEAVSLGETSSHASGVATVAPGRARGQ